MFVFGFSCCFQARFQDLPNSLAIAFLYIHPSLLKEGIAVMGVKPERLVEPTNSVIEAASLPVLKSNAIGEKGIGRIGLVSLHQLLKSV